MSAEKESPRREKGSERIGSKFVEVGNKLASETVRRFDPFGIFGEVEEASVPSPGQPRSEFLRQEIDRLRKRRSRFARVQRNSAILGLLCFVASVVLYFLSVQKEAPIVAACYGAALLAVSFLRSPRTYDTDILTIESELDLLETAEIAPQQRAEKLFKHHQLELQKYYDQTLTHSKWIFVVGVVCILVGFGIIGLTFWLVVRPREDAAFQEKVLVSLLGAAGGVLANFIAVIYLRMFSEILKSVTYFHNRLVATHNLYFANFMVTKVPEGKSRDAIIADIAKNLIRRFPK